MVVKALGKVVSSVRSRHILHILFTNDSTFKSHNPSILTSFPSCLQLDLLQNVWCLHQWARTASNMTNDSIDLGVSETSLQVVRGIEKEDFFFLPATE